MMEVLRTYQENVPEIAIEGDKAYVYEPMRDGGLCFSYAKKLVMDKKTFTEMYNKWIKGVE